VPVIRWLLALGIGLAVAWVTYGRAGGTPRVRTAVLALLRAAGVTLAAAILLGAPAGRGRPVPPLLAVDASVSVLRARTPDVAIDSLRTRVERTARELGATSLLLFGDSVRQVDLGVVPEFLPSDLRSAVGPAIDRASALGRPLVLVSDGEFDDPDALRDLTPGSRLDLVADAGGPDAALVEWSVPTLSQAGDTVRGELVVASGAGGAPGGSVEIRLDGDRVATVAMAPLAPWASTRLPVTLPLPRGARIAVLHAALSAPGDREPRNDTLATAIEVSDRVPVVFVSTAPDLDVREALTVLRGALDVPATAFLRLAPGVWRREGSLAPVAESEVRTRARSAGLLVLHGDTAWLRTDGRRMSRLLWQPAPPTPPARAGEVSRPTEWYAVDAPPSPLAGALAGIPFDSLPPISLAGPAGGDAPSSIGRTGAGPVPLLRAQLGRSGAPRTAMAAHDGPGGRTVVVSGSGYAGWAMRGGRSAEAFGAVWGAIFDWLSQGRGDERAVRPLVVATRAGEPVTWRRGGIDSVITVTLQRRDPLRASPGTTPRPGTSDTLLLRFADGAADVVGPPLAEGTYDVQVAGGASVLVVNPAREWVPRRVGRERAAPAGTVRLADPPRLADAGWPFLLVLLLVCGEWVLRRVAGLR
jgi:hypothetical protein